MLRFSRPDLYTTTRLILGELLAERNIISGLPGEDVKRLVASADVVRLATVFSRHVRTLAGAAPAAITKPADLETQLGLLGASGFTEAPEDGSVVHTVSVEGGKVSIVYQDILALDAA